MSDPPDPAPTPRRRRNTAPRRPRAAAPTRRRRALRKRAQLDAGAVIGRTFSLTGRHFPIFLVIGLIACVPSLAFEYVTYKPVFENRESLSASPDFMLRDDVVSSDFQRGTLLNLISPVLRLMGLLFLQGAVIYVVFEHLRGGTPSLARGLSIASSRLLSMLGIAAMLCIIIYVLVLGVVFVLAVFIGAATESAFVTAALALIASLVGISVVLTRFCVSIPVTIVEQFSALRAMARSDTLTQGVRWVIFGTAMVVYVVPLVVAQIAIHNWMDLENWKTAIVVAFMAQVVGGILLAVYCAVVYHDARLSSEGVVAADLARVFD